VMLTLPPVDPEDEPPVKLKLPPSLALAPTESVMPPAFFVVVVAS